MTFSKRIIYVYTMIVAVPLFLLTSLIIISVKKKNYDSIKEYSKEVARHDCEFVEELMQSFNLLEQMVGGNNELLFLLTVPESVSGDELIHSIKASSISIERTLGVMPKIYGLRIFADNPEIPERWPVILHSSRTNLLELDKWELNYSVDFMGNLWNLYEPSVCTTRIIKKNSIPIGYVQIAMKMQDFFPFLYEDKGAYERTYILRTLRTADGEIQGFFPLKNEKIIQNNPVLDYSLRKQIIEKLLSQSESDFGQMKIREKLHPLYCSWQRIPDMDLIVFHTMSAKKIQKNLWIIELFVITGFLIALLALFLIIRSATSRLMGGVYSLMSGMRQVGDGNYEVSIPRVSDDEVGEAQKNFNLMTQKIRSQIQQIKTEQQLIAETELKAMQNQINAHFLYNILETIKMQAVIAGEDDIAEGLTVLGKLMHYCLRWKVHIVALSQEIDYIRSYIYLLNLRNDYVISLQVEIPDEFLDLIIPKMILQPVVENAFVHGIEPRAQDCLIRVYAQKDESAPDRLWLCVLDSGIGIGQDELKKIRDYLMDDSYEKENTGSIGLKNIQQRLSILYGEDFRMEICSAAERGTVVRIPVRVTEEKH